MKKTEVYLSGFFAVGVLALYTRFFIINFVMRSTDNWQEVNAHWYDQLVLYFGAFSYVVLWTWMVMDYLRHRPVRWPVAWGFSLIFISQISLLLYFFMIFMPNRIEKAGDQTLT